MGERMGPVHHTRRGVAATASSSTLTWQVLVRKVRGRARALRQCLRDAALGMGATTTAGQANSPSSPTEQHQAAGEGQQTPLCSEHPLQLEEENRKDKNLYP